MHSLQVDLQQHRFEALDALGIRVNCLKRKQKAQLEMMRCPKLLSQVYKKQPTKLQKIKYLKVIKSKKMRMMQVEWN